MTETCKNNFSTKYLTKWQLELYKYVTPNMNHDILSIILDYLPDYRDTIRGYIFRFLNNCTHNTAAYYFRTARINEFFSPVKLPAIGIYNYQIKQIVLALNGEEVLKQFKEITCRENFCPDGVILVMRQFSQFI